MKVDCPFEPLNKLTRGSQSSSLHKVETTRNKNVRLRTRLPHLLLVRQYSLPERMAEVEGLDDGIAIACVSELEFPFFQCTVDRQLTLTSP